MGKIEVPGIIYSLAIAVGAWAIDYFTQGDGSGFPWAPILVAAVPILLKSLAVVTTKPEEPSLPVSAARGAISSHEEITVEPAKSKTEILLWG
jgi:hypothetical protein